MAFFYNLLFFFFLRQTLSFPAFGFQFVDWPVWTVAKSGDEVQFRCVTNLPPDSIEWHFNHRPIRNNHENLINIEPIGKRETVLTLKISNESHIYKTQEGLYQCVASVGSVSVISLPGRLEVAFLQPFQDDVADIVVTHNAFEGEPFIIPCGRPNSLPEATLAFYKDGSRLNVTTANNFFETEYGDLIRLAASPSDEGQYSCGASNLLIGEEVRSNTRHQLLITRRSSSAPLLAPHNVVYKNSQVIRKGQAVKLLCLVYGDRYSSLRWSVKDPSGLLKTELPTSSNVITIESTGDEVYECLVNSTIGTTSSNITIYVQESPHLLNTPKSLTLAEGKNLSLECNFEGYPPPTVAWVFNGQFLINNQNVQVLDDRIEMQEITREQAGVYQCFAFNPSGAAYHTSMVVVVPRTVTASNKDTVSISKSTYLYNKRKQMKRRKKKKNPKSQVKRRKKDRRKWKNLRLEGNMNIPTRPNVTKLTDESALVIWDIADRIESPVLFFKVQYQEVSGHKSPRGQWRTADENISPQVKSFEVIGLEVEHEYRFRVASVYVNNDHKVGPSSKKFLLQKSIRLQRPPNAPQITKVSAAGERAVQIFWQYEINVQTEGFIINYREAASAAKFNKITLLGENRRHFTIRPLKQMTVYEFKINSFNIAGSSDYSQRRTFVPASFNQNIILKESQSTVVIPVVRSSPEVISSRELSIALGVGLGGLLLTVVISFFCYSCKKKHHHDYPQQGKTGCICLETRFENKTQQPETNHWPLIPRNVQEEGRVASVVSDRDETTPMNPMTLKNFTSANSAPVPIFVAPTKLLRLDFNKNRQRSMETPFSHTADGM